MTGYARAAGQDAGAAWAWEAKSVNGRGLDVRCRVPPGFDVLEPAARAAVAGRFARGSFTVGLLLRCAGRGSGYRVNRALLDQVLELRAELGAAVRPGPPGLGELLSVRGLLEPVADDAGEAAEARQQAIMETLDAALAALGDMRAAEGRRLAAVLGAGLDGIGAAAARAAGNAAAQPEALRARLEQQVRALLDAAPQLPQERLLQEAALLAARSDVREELDRLAAHAAAARELLERGGAVGRRLDFLCQELLREANTLCSKAADAGLTRDGVALKTAIEQFREQVQNIE